MSRRGRDKVVIVSPSLEDGGVESYLRIVAAGMTARGYRLRVYLPREPYLPSLWSDLEAAGVTVSSFPFKSPPPANARQVVLQLIRDFLCTARALRGARATMVLTMLPHPEQSLGLVLAAALARHRSVVVVHLVPPNISITRARRALYAVARWAGQRWICVSDQNSRLLNTALAWPSGTVDTVYNGVPLLPWPSHASREAAARGLRSSLQLPSQASVILSVGRLNKQKGHDLIVDGMPTVLESVPDAYWIWAGEGAERGALLRQAKSLKVEDRLVLLGRVDSVTDLMLGSDVLLFPSRYEGFGLAAVEAQMVCLPVVVSDAGPLPQLVRAGVDGVVVPVDDSQALAVATIEVLRSTEPARTRARSAAHRARAEFSSDRMIDQILSYIPS